MAYTKGPWIQGSYDKTAVFGRDGDEVAVASFRYGESEANARLIAAAPDLLARLEATAAELHMYAPGHPPENFRGCTHADCVANRAAIAKARGED